MSRKTRKLIWSAPLVAVFAVVGALALFMMLAPSQTEAQANAAPGKPGTLTATPFASGTPEEEIELKWSAPTTGGSPTHYRIDKSTNGGKTWTSLRSNVSDTRFLHTGLKASETYHYQVFAINGSLVSVKSNTADATTKAAVKPDKPENLVAAVGPDLQDDCSTPANTGDAGFEIASCATELTATLTWTAPDNPPGAPVLGYVVEYALIETPGSWTRLKEKDGVFEIDGETATHMKLDAGRTYRYRVAAYNKTMKVDGEAVPDPNYMSAWATPDTATTLTGAAPPAIDHAGVRVGVSPAAVKLFLYWSPPEDPLGDPVNAYKVEGRPTTQKDGSSLVEADDRMCDPDPDTTGSTLECPWATIKDNIGRPSGDDINSFEVIARDVNANTRYDAYFTTKANWEYRISAKNRAMPQGTTPTTDVDLNRTVDPAADPLVLVDFLAPPGTLLVSAPADASNEGRTGLNLRWGKSTTTASTPTDAATYRIEYSNSGPGDPGGYNWMPLGTSEGGGSGLAVGVYTPVDATAVAAATQMFSDDSATVDHDPANGDDDLAAGKTRHYRVFAINTGNIMSWPSNQRSGTTKYPEKPDPPTNEQAVPAGHTSITLSWNAPDLPAATNDDMDGSEEGPSVIAGYYIQYLDEGSSSWSHIKNDAGGNLIPNITDKDGDGKDDKGRKIVYKGAGEPHTFTDMGLAPGASREYRIAAVNKLRSTEQRSDWTDLVKGSTVQIPLPNEVSGLVAEATGVGSIELSWLEQADQPEDAEVAEYVIEYSADGSAGSFEMLATVDAMTEMMVHTIYTDTMDLSPNEERHYRVFAKNARGISDQPSNVAMATTMDATVPDAPTGVTATANSDMAITVSWTAPADPAGAPVTGYKVMWKMSSADDYADADMAMVAADMMSHQVTGLTPAMEYTFKVVAMNAKGYSMAAEAMGTTHRTNTAPMAGDAIADLTITAGMTAMAQSTITDADMGDMLTWSVASDDMAIATATVDDMGEITVMGVAPGTATITVTAMDMGVGGDAMMDRMSAMQSFMVTVHRVNTAPMAGAAIADLTVTEGMTAMAQSTITDADMGDMLTWSVASDMEMYATATVDNMGMITVMGVAPGTATITVTAMDMGVGADMMNRMSAMQSFMVTVESANAAPAATVDPGDVLPDSVELMVGGDDEVITLTGSFIDPDGDMLTYSAAVMPADGSIATATVSDDNTMLTIAAVSAGMATVTVTATDPGGLYAMHEIAVTVSAERMAPSNVIVNPVGSGLVNVQWEAVPGAAGYYIVAAENSVGGEVKSEAINGGDSTLGSIGGLTPGAEYLIYVGAFFTLEDYVLEYQETITAE